MRILHITNSYGGTDVYTNLYTAIDKVAGNEQWVYVPLNPASYGRDGNKIINFKHDESKIIYSKLLKSYHSYLYGCKIAKCVSDIECKLNLKSVNLIHASTLCFDGAIAYELNKKYGIPYIVAVRNTDVNAYYKKMFWRRRYFTKILRAASKVIFISPKYKENFLKKQVPTSEKEMIESKMLVIPNGVNEVYLDNKFTKKRSIGNTINLIFVAAFYKGKGLIETIEAINFLRENGYNIKINAIGKGLPNRPQDGEYISKVERLAEGKEWIKLHPFKKAQDIIKEMRYSDVFIMVSSPETFGLVYVEALTQGLPIVYAKNQGFDGYYEDGLVGYPAKAGDYLSIAKAIECVIRDYNAISSNISGLDLEKDFKWSNISNKYINIYNELVK